MKRSRLEQAIVTLTARQSAAVSGDTRIADLDPRALLVVTLAFLVSMLSVSLLRIDMIVWFAVYPIVTAPMAGVSYERVFRNSLYVLPLLLLIGVFNPFLDREPAFVVSSVSVSRGWVTFFSIMLRGLLSVQALLILIYACGFTRMCQAMHSMGMPRVIVTQLLMVYRYLTVLLQEALSMQRARKARGYGRTSYRTSMWGAFVGQLLLRTLERSRRINMAMKARGFNGMYAFGFAFRWRSADTIFCLVWISAFVVMRIFSLSSLLLHFLNP